MELIETQAAARRSAGTSKAPREVGERRTALAYEPGNGRGPVRRIAVEFDELAQWAVVVDGVVVRYHPDALGAIDDARRLECVPSLAARERDRALGRKAARGRR